VSQNKPLLFSPISGERLPVSMTVPFKAFMYRSGDEGPWCYNPWTGESRHDSDIESDPLGLLISDGESPIHAALASVMSVKSVRVVPETPHSAPRLLDQAAKHMRDRAATYDKPEGERSMGKTVEAFNAITGRDLTESEGWLMMALLKMVRSQQRKEPHADSCEDLIAYTALFGEARLGGK
jgi:hypothetical protein